MTRTPAEYLERRHRRLLRWHRMRYHAYRLDFLDAEPAVDSLRLRHHLGPRPEDMRELRLITTDRREVAVLDYQLCATCRAGWIKKITVHQPWQRRGYATALLDRVRWDAPDYRWSTSGHRSTAKPFWAAIHNQYGDYRPAERCLHLSNARNNVPMR